MLKEIFLDLLTKYTDSKSLISELWIEIEKYYGDKKRHYHTLQHLDNLLNQLTEVKGKLLHWEAILFTLYYHDIIYNPLKSDNEEKSAEFAERRMKQISVPAETIKLCKGQILATKTHVKSTDNDTNYFTDADLSVLGETWEVYTHYYKGVRKEYSIYPNFIYNPGRKKVLNHFLTMSSIFKTDFFYQKFEQRAKLNLIKEIQLIDKSA
jgi:predicted metal-dependent HD superfamily phosphohydrolase